MIDKILLFPYYLTLKIRDRLYTSGACKSTMSDVPVISLGNITVGGTGKTPHTEMVLRMLMESERWGSSRLAVLSRGYKRRSKGFQQVPFGGSATKYGDEPVQIKTNFPTVTVAVDKNRVRGCEFLSRPECLDVDEGSYRNCSCKSFHAADLIVLDDAFQYRKLRPQLSIVLVDYNRPVYKDKLLPMGSLRDLPQRLSQADVIIVTKCPGELDEWDRTKFAFNLGINDYHSSDFCGYSPDGKRQTVLFTSIKYEKLKPVFATDADPRFKYSRGLVLFTGIANDTPLCYHLCDDYNIVSRMCFHDHHKYDSSDISDLKRIVRHYATVVVATTEKDAQRIRDCKKIPPLLKERMFMLPISVDFLSDAERDEFRRILATL